MKNEEYRFLAATKINQDGVDCKRAIYGCAHAIFTPFHVVFDVASSQNKVHRRPTSWFFLWFSYDFGVTRNSSSNADAMVAASARLRGIHPPDNQNGGRPGGNASQTRTG
jgi:hypothetical protein